MQKKGPTDEQSIWLSDGVAQLILIIVLNGGAAMIHWLSDMGPMFAFVYLAILGAMVLAVLWRYAQSWRSSRSE